MKRVVIVGASSGIGEALAKVMAEDGWEVGLCARSVDKLNALAESLPVNTMVKGLDVTDPEAAEAALRELLEAFHPVDMVVLSAGIGLNNYKLRLDRDLKTIAVNVAGFVATLNAAYHYFEQQGRGHIAGISSVAALRGGYAVPAYSASKSFISNYMEAVRMQAHKRKLNIAVSDVRPGYIQTPLVENMRGLFWVEPVDRAARLIYRGLKRRRKQFYVPGRWALVAAAYRWLPEALIRKM